MFLEEEIHNLFIFFRFGAAGSVDECSSRDKKQRGFMQEVCLEGLIGGQIFRASVPADIRVSPYNAKTGAWCINEYPHEKVYGVLSESLEITLEWCYLQS